MRMKMVLGLTLAGLAAVAMAGCGGGKGGATNAAGTKAAPAASSEAAAPEASETAPAKVADASEVSTAGGVITVKGSGSGTVGPIAFDRPYYVVKVRYDSAEEFSMFEAYYKLPGSEMEQSLAFVGKGQESVRVFQTQGQSSLGFTVKSEGTYTIEFTPPAALDTAKAAPQAFTGGTGTTVTPLVKTAGNYVMLRLKWTGPADPNRVGGMPLASATLYDAATGDEWVKNQSVYDHNTLSDDGHTGNQPGVFFAVITCSKEGGSWEATILE